MLTFTYVFKSFIIKWAATRKWNSQKYDAGSLNLFV